MKRNIKFIVIHCTDTVPTASVEGILRYWKTKLGWKNPGYHYIIKANGEVIQLLDEEIPSNGVLGYNDVCVNVCYIGGRTTDGKGGQGPNLSQQDAIYNKISVLSKKYPKAVVKGHCEFQNQGGRTCPNFDVHKWMKTFVPKELRNAGFKDDDLHKK